MKKIKFNFVSLLFLFLTISVLISDFIEYFIKINNDKYRDLYDRKFH